MFKNQEEVDRFRMIGALVIEAALIVKGGSFGEERTAQLSIKHIDQLIAQLQEKMR